MMEMIKGWLQRAWVVLLVAGVIIFFDQLTKEWIRNNVPEYTSMIPIPAFGEYFVFEHVRNYGAAFGILQNQSYLFMVIAIVVAIAILVYVRYLPLHQRFVRILLGMQLGGAVGNLIDRLMQGYVTDFVKMGIPGVYYWPNYNIADSSIVLGVIGLGIFILMDDLRQQRQQQANEQA
ncbi:MAG: signal peptidase II [Caldilineaceae bacterium]|nr:signal peptidase II [Caldilineaceae bacterium]